MPFLNPVKRGTLRWESRAKTNGNIRNCVETRGESKIWTIIPPRTPDTIYILFIFDVV